MLLQELPKAQWLRAWVEEKEVGDEAAGESRDQTTHMGPGGQGERSRGPGGMEKGLV